ncbi:MAG: guanylate kinase [Bacteroidota bacterium]
MTEKKKKLIAVSSPSGGGKSTVSRFLLRNFNQLRFSVSATTRPKRPMELWGKEYFFISKSEFKGKIANNEFVEWEQIFDNYYGTLKSEIDKAMRTGKCLLFDIDVKGALSIKRVYPDESLLIFLSPPNTQVLENRLRKRSTETEEQISVRLQRAEMELAQKELFDYIVINESLEQTLDEVKNIVTNNIAPINE